MNTTFPIFLANKLWHTTSVDRYRKILETGAILTNPPVSDKDRYFTNNGPENYPLVRTLGGISLFDFTDFNPEEYKDKYPISSWYDFVPYNKKWGESVWIEIDREKVNHRLIDVEKLRMIWLEKKLFKHTFMPKIEAAHIGNISIEYFLEVYKYNNSSGNFEKQN